MLISATLAHSVLGEENEDISLLQRISKGTAAIARRSTPAVVFISVEIEIDGQRNFQYNDPFGYFGDEFYRRFFQVPEHRPQQPRKFKRQGQGSGFLITKDGYILTNHHVVGDATKITVKLQDGRELEAERVGSDPKSEVAVIRIKGDDFPFLPIGDSAELEVGEMVLAIGNPFGLAETVTGGIVSGKGRSLQNNGHGAIADYEEFIQTDAAINPGNSGGPLLNVKGEVVGINTAIYSQTGGSVGIGFAIPINMALDIKDQLIDTGKVVRGFLGIGIQQMTPQLAQRFKLEGAEGILVTAVEKDSAADQAGIQIEDVIVKLNGNPVGRLHAFRNRIAAHQPGTEMTLVLVRGGERKTIKATAGELPGARVASMLEKLGMSVSEWNEQTASQHGYERGEGVFVNVVTPGGTAATAGIKAGDLLTSINRQSVSTVEEFKEALTKSDTSGSVLIRVRRGRWAQYIVLNLD
jgi:serine protease Do